MIDFLKPYLLTIFEGLDPSGLCQPWKKIVLDSQAFSIKLSRILEISFLWTPFVRFFNGYFDSFLGNY